MKNFDKLKRQLKEAEEKAFYGWDFSYLKGKTEEEALPWDYKNLVINNLSSEDKLLDMGTGGGEFLLTLNHPYEKTFVTEAYPPNIKLCQENLRPLGIGVYGIESDDYLPIPDHSFDVIINRHEAFNPTEVKRLLKGKNLFITQQVGGLNSVNMATFLDPDYHPPYLSNQLEQVTLKMERQGFYILMAKEYFPYFRFYDLNAFVYFAKVISWEYPYFSVDRYWDKLIALQGMIDKEGYIEVKEHRFLIIASTNHNTFIMSERKGK